MKAKQITKLLEGIKVVEEYAASGMVGLAAQLRAMQLFAHNMHNLTHGPQFMQNHSLFGELYPAYEAAYDSVVERVIGLHGAQAIDLKSVQEQAVSILMEIPEVDAAEPWSAFLELETNVRSAVKTLSEGAEDGVIQMLGDISDKSDARSYKFQQLVIK